MNGMSAGFDAMIDTLGGTGGGDTRAGFRMLDGSDGAAGIVDAAQARVARRPMSKQVRLGITLDTEMWGLSAGSAGSGGSATASGPMLTITASGVMRPLELQAIRRWL